MREKEEETRQVLKERSLPHPSFELIIQSKYPAKVLLSLFAWHSLCLVQSPLLADEGWLTLPSSLSLSLSVCHCCLWLLLSWLLFCSFFLLILTNVILLIQLISQVDQSLWHFHVSFTDSRRTFISLLASHFTNSIHYRNIKNATKLPH